eukprot:TRINITY_DN22187_c0_g1_i1.p1 TRINITY_DN22187_c0_g1~~TRINITY_DN22187_c0_g1_i1.p1  ORF type:complete len:433 (-),score=67.67 TRINITY_DN22187_c0_g1_i1:102-1373(-)
MALPQVLIVGAGMTGSLLAHFLKDAGVTVEVLEKSRGAGGRMMTRSFRRGDRSAPPLARADIGAQYITTKSSAGHPVLGPVYAQLVNRGLLVPFTGEVAGPNPYSAAAAEARPSPAADGVGPLRHYAAPQGLQSIVEHFLAADVAYEANVEEVSVTGDGAVQTRLAGATGSVEVAPKSVVVFTQPVPQVLGSSKFPVKGNFLEQANETVVNGLRQVQYSSRYAAAFFFEEGSLEWPYSWTAHYFQSGDVRYVAFDSQKRGADGESASSVVVHSAVPLGIEFLDDAEPFAAPAERLRRDVAQKLPEIAWDKASDVKVHKWRYSQVYKAFCGVSPSPSWTWDASAEVIAPAPGFVTLFETRQALGLLSGDAFAPSSNFEGCIFSAKQTASAIKGFLAAEGIGSGAGSDAPGENGGAIIPELRADL